MSAPATLVSLKPNTLMHCKASPLAFNYRKNKNAFGQR
jgi:hypothetical protein